MDTRINGTNEEKRELIRETLESVRAAPPGAKYGSMKRILARLAFEAGDEEEGIDSLIESHAIVARNRVMFKEVACSRTEPADRKTIDSKYVDFDGEYSKGYSSLMKRLKEMPQEWTVVQLTCAADPVWRFGGPGTSSWTPHVHVVRMECGPAAPAPLHAELPPPPGAEHFPVITRLHQLITENRVDIATVTRKEYWQNRRKVNSALQDVIDFTNDTWLLPLSPLLTGHLVDAGLAASLRRAVDLAIHQCRRPPQLTRTGHCLLYKTAENLLWLEQDKLPLILAKALDMEVAAPSVKALALSFQALRTEFACRLMMARRHPVILMPDNQLDLVPLEMLQVLKQQPVCRAPSLHLLHGLFKVHEASVRAGLKMVDPQRGFCVINPDGNLPAMQQRMTAFLQERCAWPQVVGALPQEQHVEQALGSDTFVYLGHGGGGHLWSLDKQGCGVRATVMLFGCRSAGFKPRRVCIEDDGGYLQYLSAACPCLLGFLWAVTDKEADQFAQEVLGDCLAGGELLRAVARARSVPDMLTNCAAAVVRGLPVVFQPAAPQQVQEQGAATVLPPPQQQNQEQGPAETVAQTQAGTRPKRRVCAVVSRDSS